MAEALRIMSLHALAYCERHVVTHNRPESWQEENHTFTVA